MYWFTESDRELCLGSEPSSLADVVVATGITADPPLNRELTESEKSMVGKISHTSVERVAEVAAKALANET